MQMSISERENVGILKARKYVGRQCQQMSVSSQLARAETDGVSEAETKQRLSSLPSISGVSLHLSCSSPKPLTLRRLMS